MKGGAEENGRKGEGKGGKLCPTRNKSHTSGKTWQTDTSQWYQEKTQFNWQLTNTMSPVNSVGTNSQTCY